MIYKMKMTIPLPNNCRGWIKIINKSTKVRKTLRLKMMMMIMKKKMKKKKVKFQRQRKRNTLIKRKHLLPLRKINLKRKIKCLPTLAQKI